MSPELNTEDLQQQAEEIVQQLEETEQQQAQQSHGFRLAKIRMAITLERS